MENKHCAILNTIIHNNRIHVVFIHLTTITWYCCGENTWRADTSLYVPGWFSPKILARIPGAFRKVITPSGMSCVGLQTQFLHLQLFFFGVVKMGERIVIVVPCTLTEKDQEEGHTNIHIYIVAFVLTAPHTLFKLTIYQPNFDKHSVLITSCWSALGVVIQSSNYVTSLLGPYLTTRTGTDTQPHTPYPQTLRCENQPGQA